jgi:hypothetical protein
LKALAGTLPLRLEAIHLRDDIGGGFGALSGRGFRQPEHAIDDSGNFVELGRECAQRAALAADLDHVGGTALHHEFCASFCQQHIARFKRPRRYRFVTALPKNHYGKVLKTELREIESSRSGDD